MKVKSNYGWRDLEWKDDEDGRIVVCIDQDKTARSRDKSTFILIEDAHGWAAFFLTRRQLRSVANKIFKELDRK